MTDPRKIPDGVSAFTAGYDGLSLRLVSEATVESDGRSFAARALWDTGATATCISEGVVESLGLIPTGKMNVRTPTGSDEVSTYVVRITLPNNVVVPDAVVCDSKIGDQGLDLLIGMDIIVRGDFAVSNYEGKTVFTFRTPSIAKADYVKGIKLKNSIGETHGPGKRKGKQNRRK